MHERNGVREAGVREPPAQATGLAGWLPALASNSPRPQRQPAQAPPQRSRTEVGASRLPLQSVSQPLPGRRHAFPPCATEPQGVARLLWPAVCVQDTSISLSRDWEKGRVLHLRLTRRIALSTQG